MTPPSTSVEGNPSGRDTDILIPCPICGFGFSSSSGLQRHLAGHKRNPIAHLVYLVGAIGFKCSSCVAEFGTQIGLYQHRRRAHSAEYSDEKLDLRLANSPPAITVSVGGDELLTRNECVRAPQNGEFQCPCGEVFKSKRGLGQHKRHKHPAVLNAERLAVLPRRKGEWSNYDTRKLVNLANTMVVSVSSKAVLYQKLASMFPGRSAEGVKKRLIKVSVLAELTLEHLRYHLTDVPSQSNSPPDIVFRTGRTSHSNSNTAAEATAHLT
ncbi:hypothetical protein P879_11572 [Paragonimus westermani]|uniref:C2H2-type domain-containing protein n=1 Tax=Paragonimus westermani TaxID=34504 RepID=A0A8T0D9C8_9TREM|nr:hypothetical protein P879_11572 [Paragonimus westermani]